VLGRNTLKNEIPRDASKIIQEKLLSQILSFAKEDTPGGGLLRL
jgi:hypothetical protein